MAEQDGGGMASLLGSHVIRELHALTDAQLLQRGAAFEALATRLEEDELRELARSRALGLVAGPSAAGPGGVSKGAKT